MAIFNSKMLVHQRVVIAVQVPLRIPTSIISYSRLWSKAFMLLHFQKLSISKVVSISATVPVSPFVLLMIHSRNTVFRYVSMSITSYYINCWVDSRHSEQYVPRKRAHHSRKQRVWAKRCTFLLRVCVRTPERIGVVSRVFDQHLAVQQAAAIHPGFTKNG